MTTALRCPIQRSAITPPRNGVKYTKPEYSPKICEASAWFESGPAIPSIQRRKPANPAMCSTCPGSNSWFTMYSTTSAVMP